MHLLPEDYAKNTADKKVGSPPWRNSNLPKWKAFRGLFSGTRKQNSISWDDRCWVTSKKRQPYEKNPHFEETPALRKEQSSHFKEKPAPRKEQCPTPTIACLAPHMDAPIGFKFRMNELGRGSDVICSCKLSSNGWTRWVVANRHNRVIWFIISPIQTVEGVETEPRPTSRNAAMCFPGSNQNLDSLTF